MKLYYITLLIINNALKGVIKLIFFINYNAKLRI